MATAYVALGANLGDRVGALRRAVQRLGALGQITAVSSLYETEPVGYHDQPAFLNAAVALVTPLAPTDLMQELLMIERNMGRMRTFLNAPRTLDLDLLLWDELIVDNGELVLPHPRLHERAFVLVPLAEINPEVRHPILKRSAAELLSDLADQGDVEVFASRGWEHPES